MRGLNPDQLHAFADVIELGSFSAAAVRQNLSQPAISQQIRQLEARLGVRLIERVGKRAMPTRAGQELLTHIGRIDQAMNDALAAVAGHADGMTGMVRIGTGATACIYLLPKVLDALQRRFPNIEIVVKTGNTVDILKLIEENSLDIGLVTQPVTGRCFDTIPILEDAFVAIAATKNGLPDIVPPTFFADVPLVLYERGAHTRKIVDGWLQQAGVATRSIMELGSVEAIKELVGAGLGASILPGMGVLPGRTQLPLIVRPLTPSLGRQLALVMRRDKKLTAGLREVRDGIMQAATDQSSSGT
ncbi:LysR family transcriptional regulator [Thalassospira sp.]|uniref:LysR family transcriptional regulator n=1 Tax=Thalassospira sp. TaxID=1912094 RepID=UPI002735F1CD|nr:LysR family transcriptional regulator [Thalassospira sp.]MDP2699876.1 LysR family transcriptional regulator [Thalassospira sp.]